MDRRTRSGDEDKRLRFSDRRGGTQLTSWRQGMVHQLRRVGLTLRSYGEIGVSRIKDPLRVQLPKTQSPSFRPTHQKNTKDV